MGSMEHRVESRSVALIAFLAACAMPRYAPAGRTGLDRSVDVVRIVSSCGEQTALGVRQMDDAQPMTRWQSWAPSRAGTAVLIDERHALTAAHVVGCAVIPNVQLWLPDAKQPWPHHGRGLWQPAWVDRDDVMFGTGADVARLWSPSDNFDLSVAPPIIGEPDIGDRVCVVTLHDEKCGLWTPPIYGAREPWGWVNVATQDFDSGSPAFDEKGRLVGLVVGRDESGKDTAVETRQIAEMLR